MDKIIKQIDSDRPQSYHPLPPPSTTTHTYSHGPYVTSQIFHHATPTPTLYLRELLEGQLEAASVVGDTLGCDALHGVFQHPLVADVGLHQVREARRVAGLVIELEREEGRRDDGKWREGTRTYFLSNMRPVFPSLYGGMREIKLIPFFK